MDKIFVLSQMVYNDCDETYNEILGAFTNYKEARKEMEKIVKHNIDEFDFIIDKECDFEKFEFRQIKTRLFLKYQENWSNYIEIKINEIYLK